MDSYSGKKGLVEVKKQVRVLDDEGRVWAGPSFPMDSEARYCYYSRVGGFVPVEAAVDTIFTNPISYGYGGFEGERLFRTMYGDGFVELSHNIARFIYSSLAFNLSLITGTLKLLDNPDVDHVEHLQRTPKEFFVESTIAMECGNEVEMRVKVFYKNGTEETTTVPFKLVVKTADGEKVFTMKEMETATCALAALNGLIRDGAYPPNALQLVLGGYFRPIFWGSGEEGLRVPTIIRKDGVLVDKPLYLGIGTLPWGLYLPDEGYVNGLRVLVAPLLRIDDSMPVSQKIAGNYVNCARNINMAIKLGFGEVIALNHNEEFVEGSAENIVVLITNKKTGEMRALCPPLSAHILAGTTRDRVMLILDRGLRLSGKNIELVLEAPKKQFIIDSLEGKTGWDVSAIVFMGTGVGMIHARSITENHELREWMKCNDLRSEETRHPEPLFLRRLEETAKTYEINGGVMHPFVNALRKAYVNYALGNAVGSHAARITPAYFCLSSSRIKALEKVMGLAKEEFCDRETLKRISGGYFDERINGLKQPGGINKRNRLVRKAVTAGARLSMDRRCVGRAVITS